MLTMVTSNCIIMLLYRQGTRARHAWEVGMFALTGRSSHPSAADS